MNNYLKKIFFNTALNITFFLLLMVGIQNSSKSYKVNFLLGKTINLPTGFIVGVSFISGSITGGLLTLNNWKKN